MNTRLVLSLCLLTVISACAPAATPPLPPREETRVMETATPTLVPNRPLTLAAPSLPLQVDGLDVPQEDGAVLLLAAETSSLPEGARRARTDVVRAEMHLVPVAVAEGMVLSAESKGRTACAVLPAVSRRNPDNPDELQTLALDEELSAKGEYWVYTYGGVSQYVPKRVTEPGGSLGVYLAVDYRLGADGKAYFVAVDADGHLKQVMEAVSDEPQAGRWRAAAPGEFGLGGHEALLNAAGLTGNVEKTKTEYDPNLHGNRVTVYAFTDEAGAVHEYRAEQIEWLALGEKTQVDEAGQARGLVVLRNAEGRIEYAWTENKWVKVEPVKSPNGTDAVTMSAAGWQFIEVGKRLLVLDPSQNELNAQGQEVVVSEAGERYVWGENGWEKEGPPIKEFIFCPDIKKYREAYIPPEDLLSGAYHAWLEREFPQEYDLNTIQQVPFFNYQPWPAIVYDRRTPHNFGDRENRPYVNDLTFGYTEYAGIVYIVMPVNFHDPANPGHGRWVVAVWPRSIPGYEITEAHRQEVIDIWLKNYRITPIVMGSVIPMAGVKDPLVAETFKKWPDMASRFQAVLDNGDVAQISEPGMVLMTYVTTGAEVWFR